MTRLGAEPVPSVLPEEGIDLKRELDRYRDWILEQTLIRTRNNVAHAAALVHWTEQSLHNWLKRKGIDLPPGPKGRHARRWAEPTEPAAAEPRTERSAPKSGVMARIDWAYVERLRSEGLSDVRIAQKLAWKTGVHKWSLEKLIRQGRPEEAR